MYAAGKGVPENYDQALDWWEKSANAGYIHAQFFLGIQLLREHENLEEAVTYLSKAISQRHEQATTISGDIANEYNKNGNFKQAYIWINICIAHGSQYSSTISTSELNKIEYQISHDDKATAQYDLGWMYYRGEGTEQDYRMAYAWLKHAMHNGDQDADSLLVVVEKKLNEQSLSEAEELLALNESELSQEYYNQFDKKENNKVATILVPPSLVKKASRFARKKPMKRLVDAEWTPPTE